MARIIRENLWKRVKQIFNENPQGIPMSDITDKIPIKSGFIKNNPHLIVMEYVGLLRRAGFLKVVHTISTSKNYFIRIYVPIWKIPENITTVEVENLLKQPAWVLWFMYPEGNIM